jgi:NDP-sugar pyrophosphorylase family protein
MCGFGDTTAVILAGGLGTRLRETVSDRSKVVAEVGGRPFITRIFDQLGAAGVRHVVLCTGYKAKGVEALLGDRFGEIALSYSPEPEQLGTGGALRNALGSIRSDEALVLNGDSYFSSNPLELKDFHRKHDAIASIMLSYMKDVASYGQVRVTESEEIQAFEEKSGVSAAGWVNAGVYLLRKDQIASIPSGKSVSLERETFPGWIGKGLYGYKAAGTLLDIGTPERYANAEAFFDSLDRNALQG